jgi:hypothetical protein
MLLGFAALGFLSNAALAQIIPLTFNASANASGQFQDYVLPGLYSYSLHDSSSDPLGALSVNASKVMTVPQTPYQGFGSTATVRSTATEAIALTSTGLSVNSIIDAQYGPVTGAAFAAANASFTFTFRVDVPTPYSLSVSLFASKTPFPGDIVSLPSFNGLGAVLVPTYNSDSMKAADYTGSGVLVPGIYTISRGKSVSTGPLDPLGRYETATVRVSLIAAVQVPDSGSTAALLLIALGLLAAIPRRCISR